MWTESCLDLSQSKTKRPELRRCTFVHLQGKNSTTVLVLLNASIRRGRNIENVSNTLFFLIFHQERFLGFHLGWRSSPSPRRARRQGTRSRKRNRSLNWFTYYFCFQQQKAENGKKLSEKSAKINAESKKISDPYRQGLLLGSSRSWTAAREKVARNSAGT